MGRAAKLSERSELSVAGWGEATSTEFRASPHPVALVRFAHKLHYPPHQGEGEPISIHGVRGGRPFWRQRYHAQPRHLEPIRRPRLTGEIRDDPRPVRKRRLLHQPIVRQPPKSD